MSCLICKKWSLFITITLLFGLPSIMVADATDAADSPHEVESSIEIEFFNVGDSKSSIGNAQVSTSGVIIQTEYEKNDMVLTFNYERWNYSWLNAETLPFAVAAGSAPWSKFNTLQFGFDYEQQINDQWELNYYIEVESSFEKETSGSSEYELGIDFTYEPSKAWIYTINVNVEYLDATGTEFGVDLEIEWNHDKKEGWSGEFEISSEFPETSLTYHFTREFSTTMFFNESGTSTIRLSDSSPLADFQGGYLEDEYNSIGFQFDYEFTHEGYLSFSVQQNSGRNLSLINRNGGVETNYAFADSTEVSLGLKYTF